MIFMEMRGNGRKTAGTQVINMRQMMEQQGMQIPESDDPYVYLEQILNSEKYEVSRVELTEEVEAVGLVGLPVDAGARQGRQAARTRRTAATADSNPRRDGCSKVVGAEASGAVSVDQPHLGVGVDQGRGQGEASADAQGPEHAGVEPG